MLNCRLEIWLLQTTWDGFSVHILSCTLCMLPRASERHSRHLHTSHTFHVHITSGCPFKTKQNKLKYSLPCSVRLELAAPRFKTCMLSGPMDACCIGSRIPKGHMLLYTVRANLGRHSRPLSVSPAGGEGSSELWHGGVCSLGSPGGCLTVSRCGTQHLRGSRLPAPLPRCKP